MPSEFLGPSDAMVTYQPPRLRDITGSMTLELIPYHYAGNFSMRKWGCFNGLNGLH